MLDRRELLTLGGILGVAAPANGEGVAAGQNNDAGMREVANEVRTLRQLIERQESFGELDAIRTKLFDHLRANGKFPDFLDVGITVWLQVHDWHIRMHQPLSLSRDTNGRYTMEFGFTTLVLRQDSVVTFIGIPYDQR